MEVIRKSTAFLERKGVPSARLQSELLLSHVLNRPRLRLYLEFDRPVPETALEAMRQLVKRRAAREPLQHLLGSVAFADFELRVGPQALIPRPETELVLETASQWLKEQQPGATHPPAILDWGTGTGCLAIGLARRFPAAVVTALDLSPAALELARVNAELNGVASRITFLLSNGFSSLPAGQRFDLMVSNPPYIPSGEIDTLEPEVRDHDPRLALDGGPDGLEVYRRLAAESPPFLAAGGRLVLELGHNQAAAVREIFTGRGWRMEKLACDDLRLERVMVLGR